MIKLSYNLNLEAVANRRNGMLVIVDSFRLFQFFKQNITIKTGYSQNFGADILTHYYSIQKYSQLINKNRSERTIKKKLG